MTAHSSARRHRTVLHVLLTVLLIAAALLAAARFAPWEFSIGNLVIRSQQGTTLEFPAPPDADLVTASRRAGVELGDAQRPRNIILVIGDGMGVGQVSSASAMLHGPRGGLVLEDAPVTGLMSTYAGNLLVTDSAASVTALATGFKTLKKAISVLSDGREAVTIFEAARARGLSTGVVTTSGLVDATPAGFTAHSESRYSYDEILEDMLASGAEVLIGGDWSDYEKALENAAFQNQLDRIDELAGAAGYSAARDAAELDATDGPVLALFPPRPNLRDAHGPPLDDLALFAVDRLAGNETGFVLLVESEVTDGEGHANHVAGVVEGVRELDRTVADLLAWAEPRGDTLIVVTADHDTGGLGIVDGEYTEGVAEVRWASDQHTAQWVPLFAFGPGAEVFAGVIDNTDIAILFAKLLEIEDFPRAHP